MRGTIGTTHAGVRLKQRDPADAIEAYDVLIDGSAAGRVEQIRAGDMRRWTGRLLVGENECDIIDFKDSRDEALDAVVQRARGRSVRLRGKAQVRRNGTLKAPLVQNALKRRLMR